MSTNDTQSSMVGCVKSKSALGETSTSLASPSQSKESRERCKNEIRFKMGVRRICGSREFMKFDLIDVNGASAGKEKTSRDHACKVISYTQSILVRAFRIFGDPHRSAALSCHG